VPTTAVAGVLAVFAAGLGVLALPAVAEELKAVLAAEGEPPPRLGELVLSGVLAVAVLGGSLAVARARPDLVERLSRSPLGSWVGLGRLLSPRSAMAMGRDSRYGFGLVGAGLPQRGLMARPAQ
jgi:hypothetical protein